MDVVGAGGLRVSRIFAAVEASVGGWVGGGGRSVCETQRRLGCGLSGDPGALVPRRTAAGREEVVSRFRAAVLTGFSLAPCVPPGGPRHHDPQEQVEKVRWQHHFHQLHP
jgi:hypothetical protein